MLSLSKVYTLEELEKWREKRAVFATLKLDGSSCSLIYKNGKFSLAKTRGDGTYGEDITSKVLWMDSVPKNIKGDCEIRGEIVCTEENFIKLSNEMSNRKLDRPKSQRNIVAGLLSRKDKIDLSKYLSFFAFEVLSDHNFQRESEKFEYLKSFGFNSPKSKLLANENEVFNFIEDFKKEISKSNLLVDGLVFTFEECDLHKKLGETAHHPKYKMAFKLQGQTAVTKVLSILWNVSRNGVLTPVAQVKPVEISNAIIQRVTLHNYGLLASFKIKKNDRIEIVRSGEVIPKFLSVVESSNNEFTVPKICPKCKTKVVFEDIRIICPNVYCPARFIESLVNFISKMGIEDLSRKRIEGLVDKKLITSFESIYDLKKEELMSLDQYQEKLSNKIISNIEKSKNIELIKFVSALGLRGGAENKCQKIINAGFDTIEKFLNISVEELAGLEGWAEKSASDFVQDLRSKRPMVIALINKGLKFKIVENINLYICLTGKMSRPRKEIENKIKNYGGNVQSNVSKDTTYLVTNDKESKSSKTKKAKEYNVKLISEEELYKLLEK